MSDKETKVIAEGWISTKEAAALVGYTAEYVRQLARRGRIRAEKATREWLINRDSLLEHKQTVKPGRPKESEQ